MYRGPLRGLEEVIPLYLILSATTGRLHGKGIDLSSQCRIFCVFTLEAMTAVLLLYIT